MSAADDLPVEAAQFAVNGYGRQQAKSTTEFPILAAPGVYLFAAPGVRLVWRLPDHEPAGPEAKLRNDRPEFAV